MPETDKTSLSNLHDIVVLEPVSWWPLAPGWWVFLSLLALVLLIAGWRFYQQWKRNRYRQAALRELEDSRGNASQIPALLKRVALVAYPRAEVANLTGERWLAFLNRQCSATSFDDRLLSLAYDDTSISEEDQRSVLNAADMWIRNHSVKQA